MKLKQLIGGVTISPARLAHRRWVWVPVWQTPLRYHHPLLRAPHMARAHLVPRAIRADPAQADPVTTTRVAQADPVTTARADLLRPDPATTARADLLRPVPATTAPADPATTARADPATTARADPVVRAGLAGPVDPAARGMEMDSVATSTEPRGALDPRRGDRVSRHRQGGADRSHRRGASGTMAQSTTGATRKHPIGIKGPTSGASISSGSGSRCKERSHAAPAWPNG